jgi:hypothetical protein
MGDRARIHLGTFRSTYGIETVRGFLLDGIRGDLDLPVDATIDPPVIRAVYVSEQSDARLVIKAGNRLEDAWVLVVEFAADLRGSSGAVWIEGKPMAWWERAANVVADLEHVLRMSSAPEIDFAVDPVALLS